MRRFVELVMVVLVAGSFAGRVHAQLDRPELVDAVVASVDGTPITLVDLEKFSDGPGRLLSQQEQASRAALLDTMVNMKMFDAEFERQGIKASDSDVDVYISNVMEQNGSSRAQIEEALKKLDLSWEDYFERMRQEVQRITLINREIRARVNVTPEEVERAWKEDPKYMQPERLEIGHIYMPVGEGADASEARARAQLALELARKNFDKAAAEYSEGPNAKDGGVLGTFKRDEMAESFQRAVQGLEPGDVSDVFEDAGAFHIVKVIRTVEPERIPFDKVRHDLEEKIYSATLEARFKRWVDEDLRKRHHITMQLDGLDDLLDAPGDGTIGGAQHSMDTNSGGAGGERNRDIRETM
jgi:peptidyl-prolyl cis-trans isomerase SurA